MNPITTMKQQLLSLLLALPLGMAVQAQNINFTGGAADLTFYFESTGPNTGNWFSVFRAKGTANQPTSATATELTSPFTGFTGIAGNQVPAVPGNTGDYNFNSLMVTANTAGTATVGGTTFFTLTASGSPFNPTVATPDLGIRTRFASQSTNQFPGGMRLTLDVANSLFNGVPLASSGAHVGLFYWEFSEPIALINTNGGSSFADFAMSGHVHRNWGFTHAGTYNLAFNMSGLGGTGDYANVPPGSVGVSFNVIPEPSTFLLLIAGAGIFAGSRRFRAKRHG